MALDAIKDVAGKYIELARSFLAAGDLRQASNYLDKAVELNSDDPDITALKSDIAVVHELAQVAKSVSDTPVQRPADGMNVSDRRKFMRIKNSWNVIRTV